MTGADGFREGARAGIPIAFASALIGLSFGVLAEPELGVIGAVVMSAVVFAGSAQFAAVAVLAAGGGVVAAVVAGALLNMRFLPMGIALAPSVRGGVVRRALTGQAIIDVSWAMAAREGGRFAVPLMLGFTASNFPAWVGGTLIGAVAGDIIGDPKDYGLDAMFPAFFLGLLWTEVAEGDRRLAAGLGAAVALALIPVAPAGIPIIAACVPAVVLGLVRGR